MEKVMDVLGENCESKKHKANFWDIFATFKTVLVAQMGTDVLSAGVPMESILWYLIQSKLYIHTSTTRMLSIVLTSTSI